MPCGQPLQGTYDHPANPGAEGWEDLHVRTTVDSNSEPGFPEHRPSGTPGRPGVPASHQRRGRAVDDGRTATTPMVRRRPPSWRGEVHRIALPEVARSAVVLGASPCRWVVQAQLRTRHARCGAICPQALGWFRHAPVSVVFRVSRSGRGLGFGCGHGHGCGHRH